MLSCPYCHNEVRGLASAAHWFVFNVASRQVLDHPPALRAGDLVIFFDSFAQPEDHVVHRCDDPNGTRIASWLGHRASDTYQAINAAIRALQPVG